MDHNFQNLFKENNQKPNKRYIMTKNTQFKIHPAIGIARVGNSSSYFLGPETMAGTPAADGDKASGGAPIKPGTENELVTSSELRDNDGKLKRQAARFKIFEYPEEEITNYPTGQGTEITIGSTVTIGGNTNKITNIIWTCHLANKKANSWDEPENGIDFF